MIVYLQYFPTFQRRGDDSEIRPFIKFKELQIKMHLLSTACTAERREKSHYNDAGRQETMLC